MPAQVIALMGNHKKKFQREYRGKEDLNHASEVGREV